MNKRILCFVLTAALSKACSQNQPFEKPTLKNAAFERKIDQLISFSVPVIGVHDLFKNQDKYVIFDAREKEEFDISHIPGASYIGFRDFDENRLKNIPKKCNIVVYCSIGYRSEKIAEKLLRLGYPKVYNLYGSIFEWTNEKYPLTNAAGNATNSLHCYNKTWSKWVTSGKVKKVW
jgi:rhodanese-related sulfurtransferase